MTTTAVRRGSLGRKLLLLMGVLVLGAVAIEVAARVRLHFRYGRTDNEFYRSRLDPALGFRVPLPNQDVGFIHINERGFRGPDVAVPKPPGTIRLAFLGGSTTFCAEVSGDEQAWPAVVCRLLDERVEGVSFDYVNAGLPALRAAESLQNLEHRVAPLEPDIVVIYHATNDLSRDTRDLAEAQGLFTGDGGRQSAFARASVAWDLIEKNLRVIARQRSSTTTSGRLQFEPAALAAEFRAVLEPLARAAQAHARRVVVLTFATRFRAEQPAAEQLAAANTSLFYMPYMDVERLLHGFAAYNRVVRDVAHERGALLVEAANAVPGDARHFHDSVHLTDAGCAVLGEHVAAALLADPGFRMLIEDRRAAR